MFFSIAKKTGKHIVLSILALQEKMPKQLRKNRFFFEQTIILELAARTDAQNTCERDKQNDKHLPKHCFGAAPRKKSEKVSCRKPCIYIYISNLEYIHSKFQYIS